MTIPVIDLFAGAGGLGEGFSSVPGNRFEVALSIEKDPQIYQTLLLRKFFRCFPTGKLPAEYYKALRGEIEIAALYESFPVEAAMARARTLNIELSQEKATCKRVRDAIKDAVGKSKQWVLVGGPPCQAYSIVGRVRNKGNPEYEPEKDERHFLYQEYLNILNRYWPPVFVFENVTGLLSAKVKSKRIFEEIISDLSNPGECVDDRRRKKHQYKLYPLNGDDTLFSNDQRNLFDEELFVIKAEHHGVPQTRHRIIIVGVRDDIPFHPRKLLHWFSKGVNVGKVINDLPEIRSKLSKGMDSPSSWQQAVLDVCRQKWYTELKKNQPLVYNGFANALDRIRVTIPPEGGSFVKCNSAPQYLARWYGDKNLGGIPNHESRQHIGEDLWRYLYCASWAEIHGTSPKLRDFPTELLPKHKNVNEVTKEQAFDDRFRVQVTNNPATTITSHISKDGHYFIHPDPAQCRSLTVREVARIQSFPDNYFFCGSRTSQYTQVGNAVPPLLARRIAKTISQLFHYMDECQVQKAKVNRSYNMSRIRSRNTEPERKVEAILHQQGCSFRMHCKELPGSPDFVLDELRIAIFIHGCFCHRHTGCEKAANPKTRQEFWQRKFQENIYRDDTASENLKLIGWSHFVIWECELENEETAIMKIRTILGPESR